MQLSFSSFIRQAAGVQPNDELLLSLVDGAVQVIGQTPVASRVHRIAMAVRPIWALLERGVRSLFKIPIPFSLPVRNTAIFRPTTKLLEEGFGKARLPRLLQRMGLTLAELEWRGYGITRTELSILLKIASMSTVQDVEELLLEIQSSSSSVRYSEDLRARFLGKKSVYDCSKEDLDCLMKILQPCPSVSDFLMGSVYEDEVGMRGVLPFPPFEREAMACFHLARNDDMTEDERMVLFLKRLTRRSPPSGFLLRLKHGYLALTNTVESSGVSKLFFKSLHPEQLRSKIIYRGTRGPMVTTSMGDSILSIREDCTKEVGSRGIEETFEATKALLEDPALGFVRSSDELVDVCGYSLGGAQAMRDAVLFEKRIASLWTLCSLAIDKKTAELFARKMKERTMTMPITHIVDADDVCSDFGEVLLGAGCQNTPVEVKVVCQIPSYKEPYPFPHGSSYVSRVDRLRRGIGSHVRVACYGSYRVQELTQKEPDILEKYLLHSPEYFDSFWEKMRGKIALDRHPFYDFVQRVAR